MSDGRRDDADDGGIETYLLFHEGFELPCFASFPLLEDERGRAALRRYDRSALAEVNRRAVEFIRELAAGRRDVILDALSDRLPGIQLRGGCCGTDHRHVAEIAAAWGST